MFLWPPSLYFSVLLSFLFLSWISPTIMGNFVSWENHIPSPLSLLLSFLSLAAWITLIFLPCQKHHFFLPVLHLLQCLHLISCFPSYPSCSSPQLQGSPCCFHLLPWPWANWMCCAHSLSGVLPLHFHPPLHFFPVCSAPGQFAGRAPQGTDDFFLSKYVNFSCHLWFVSQFQHRLPLNERKHEHFPIFRLMPWWGVHSRSWFL